ncbi:hypothetical protein [Deinococcus fonticola]|uniref:hypothetical protein n=1 Tax=Deinococcus fonticola TaxID=2528713 RepID=UPI001074B51C|nr:hypothetical protein [Deinococcus fonticola]
MSESDGFVVSGVGPIEFGATPVSYSLILDDRLSDAAHRVMVWMLARCGARGSITLAEVVDEFGAAKTKKVMRELQRNKYFTRTDNGFELHDVALDRPVVLL